MYQECTFYADAIGNTANRKRFADTAVLTADDDTFKNLDTFAVSFDNLYMDLDCVARAECGNVAAKLFLFKYADDIHFFSSYKTFVFPVAAVFHGNRQTNRGLPKLTREIISQPTRHCKHFLQILPRFL